MILQICMASLMISISLLALGASFLVFAFSLVTARHVLKAW